MQVDVFLAFDDADQRLGDYFSKCARFLCDYAEKDEVQHKFLNSPSRLCTIADVQKFISTLEGKNFGFVVYSHGGDEGLIANGELFITKKDAYLFGNGFIYAIGCHAAISLGQDFVNNSAHCFIGYADSVNILDGDCLQDFIECDNWGLIEFLYHSKSAGQATESMRHRFLDVAERMRDAGQILEYVTFAASARALVVLGNRDVTLQQLLDHGATRAKSSA